MIELVSAGSPQHGRFDAELRALPRARFYDRLPQLRARDAAALRIVHLGADGTVVAALTLLPTSSADLLDGAAPQLLPEGRRIASPLIWEARDLAAARGVGRAGVLRALAEIALAVNDIGRALGLTHVVAVCDAATHRWAGRRGWAGAPLGPPQRLAGCDLLAVTYEIGGAFDAHVRALAAEAGLRLDPPHLRPDTPGGWIFDKAGRS